MAVSIRSTSDSALVIALPTIVIRDNAEVFALDTLRERTTAGVAALISQYASTFLPPPPTTELPPRYELYARFVTGVRSWNEDYNARAVEMLRSAVDPETTYATPLVWLARTYRDMGECDSVAVVGHSSGHRALTVFERAYIEMQVAHCGGDWPVYEAASRRVMQSAPGSAFAIAAGVNGALSNNHFRRADSLIRHALPLDSRVAGFYHRTYHALGDYGHDLASITPSFAKDESNGRLFVYREVFAALAGLGDTSRIERMSDSLLAETSSDTRNAGAVMHATAVELDVHGYHESAAAMYLRAAQWYASQPACLTASVACYQAARAFADNRQEALASRLLISMLKSPNLTGRLEENVRGELGAIAARKGVTAEAKAADAWLSRVPPKFTYGNAFLWRARLAILEGDTAAAIAHIRNGLAVGACRWECSSFVDSIHEIPEYAVLAKNHQFAALVSPQ